jgi:Zn-dependent M16 (insulinase) family peptidase
MTLDRAAIEEIKQSNIELQRSQETLEDTSCLPILEIADIESKEPSTACRKQDIAECHCYWLPQPTNGISYLNIQFAVNALDRELRPYLPIFCALLPQIGAAGHDYLAMSRRITAMTGGIRLGTNFMEGPEDLDVFRPTVELKGKALERNQGALCEIIADMLAAPDFSDIDRLKTVIGQVRTSMENSIPGAGHSFAARAAAASLTPTAAQREYWNGMTQVNIIRDITGRDDNGMKKLSQAFSAIAKQLFCRANISVAVTAEEQAMQKIETSLTTLLSALPDTTKPGLASSEKFTIKSRATGWHYNLPVAYVARVFRTVSYTHPDAPALMVLAKLLRSDFLHREIREKGGAYGGMAGYNSDGGLFSMLSYRDPHIERTLNVYSQAIEWACHEKFSKEMIKESILTAFAELDRPLSPGGRGYREFIHQQQGMTHDMIQNFRDGILAVDQKKVNQVAQTYLQQGAEFSSIGILAGEEMFDKAAQTLAKINTTMKRLD